MKNNPRIRYSGNLGMHWSWSVVLSLSLVVLVALNFRISTKAGIVTLLFTCCYFVLILGVYLYYRPRILRGLVDFATSFGQKQEEILRQIELPVTIVSADGRILWMNDRLCELSKKPEDYDKNIDTLFPELQQDTFPAAEWDKDVQVHYENMDFRAHMQRIVIDDLIDGTELISREARDGESSYFYIIYFLDETDLNRLRQENRDQRFAVALVDLDNYDEALEGVDEVHSSLISVLADRQIMKYFTSYDCLPKKLEKDKYMVVFNRKSLDSLMADHFSVLESVKTINIGNEVSITLSIGAGIGGKTYIENYEKARSAIEMALGRGGDQAVVNNASQMTFFGGKSQRNEQHTRVKARVKAQAMREIMITKNSVIAMGHRFMDMDSLGAAVGICRAARALGKPAHIVMGTETGSISQWLELLKESKDYKDGLFISHDQALAMTDESTAVIVVDTNRPSLLECGELLNRTDTVVVLDHHRQNTEKIENASLSYIEPSASSACEMIAEILQYFEENVRLRSLEADCMYAGILIDTNNFVAKTGARTFEAAAYLRRSGADITRVRKLLRDDMDSYKARAEAVRNAEIYMGAYAISILPPGGLKSPNVVGAQAANELLNIVGVRASFVLTDYENEIFISARSIDEANVQLVMEKLGGGGHISMAGAQLKGMKIEEARDKLKEVLKQMTDEKLI